MSRPDTLAERLHVIASMLAGGHARPVDQRTACEALRMVADQVAQLERDSHRMRRTLDEIVADAAEDTRRAEAVPTHDAKLVQKFWPNAGGRT